MQQAGTSSHSERAAVLPVNLPVLLSTPIHFLPAKHEPRYLALARAIKGDRVDTPATILLRCFLVLSFNLTLSLRWITDAQVEFSVRQITPKRKPKPLVPISSKRNKRSVGALDYVSPFKLGGHPTPPASTAAAAFNSKRLRTKAARASDAPGAKRARAMALVTRYVERHYGELGIAWPPERPTESDHSEVEEGETDGGGDRASANTSRRRRSDKKRQGYHGNGIVGGNRFKPPVVDCAAVSDATAKSGAPSTDLLRYCHNRSSGSGIDVDDGRAFGVPGRVRGGENHGYDSSEARGGALSLLAEVVAGGSVLELNVRKPQEDKGQRVSDR